MNKLLLVLSVCLILSACNSPKANMGAASPPIASTPTIQPLQHKTGLIVDKKRHYGKVYWRPLSLYQAIGDGTVPDSYDVREHGGQVDVYDQGQCGSCWAFGTTTTSMINLQIASGTKSPNLSPQAIVSCDTTNDGCEGGNFAGDYVQKNGLPTMATYPYTASDGNCQSFKSAIPLPTSFVYIGAPDRSPTEDEVDAAIYQFGAVAVSAGADNAWESAPNGVMTQGMCNGTPINHEITAVAYNKPSTTITIQNSWGTNLPGNGFLTMPWGCDGMANDAGYFVFNTAPVQPISVHLPAEYIINAGDDLIMTTDSVLGVTYQWLQGMTVIGTGNQVTVKPTSDTVYNLIAKNGTGEVEIQTLVTIKK